jgi:hypothetical protein
MTYFCSGLFWQLKSRWIIIKNISICYVQNVTFNTKYSRISIVRDCLELLHSSDHTCYDDLEHTVTYRHGINTHYILYMSCITISAYTLVQQLNNNRIQTVKLRFKSELSLSNRTQGIGSDKTDPRILGIRSIDTALYSIMWMLLQCNNDVHKKCIFLESGISSPVLALITDVIPLIV